MTPIPLLVLDTNILVSALLSPYGAPAKIWDLVLARQVQLAYDDRILVEYNRVLRRPKFGFSSQRIDAMLAVFLFQLATQTTPWPLHPLPDKDDAAFLEVADAASATLVTGNMRHFPTEITGEVRVMSPHDWLGHYFK